MSEEDTILTPEEIEEAADAEEGAPVVPAEEEPATPEELTV